MFVKKVIYTMRDNTNVMLPDPIYKIDISHLPDFDIADYDFSDPKEMKKYFFDVERICRTSRSYSKQLIPFLREHIDMNKCSFYENINNLDTYSLKIHIHHTPFTLFDIVETIFTKRLAHRESLSPFMVAKEVMYVHFNMMIGLIPLSETVHELTHNGFLFIPTTNVFGKYWEFMNQYRDYMNAELLRAIEQAEEYSKTYDYSKETKVLTMGMVHIDPSGAYTFPNMEDIRNLMQNKLDRYDSMNTDIILGSEYETLSSMDTTKDPTKKQVVEFIK